MPRNQPLQRLLDFGIIPKSKYTLDVYLEVGKYFPTARNTEEIAQKLKDEYPSLSKARISREFVKKAIKLLSAVILPEMVRYVPKDGNWALMIDGTNRSKDDDVLIIIAAVPLDGSQPQIIPLHAKFLPSENTRDVKQLFYELKPRLPSLPKSIISDFRLGLVEAIGSCDEGVSASSPVSDLPGVQEPDWQ